MYWALQAVQQDNIFVEEMLTHNSIPTSSWLYFLLTNADMSNTHICIRACLYPPHISKKRFYPTTPYG